MKLRSSSSSHLAVNRAYPYFRAIESGANTIAEGFLFSVAAAIVMGESWRSSRNTTKRRVSVDDQLDELGEKVEGLRLDLHSVVNVWEQRWAEERQRYGLVSASFLCRRTHLFC